MQSIAQIQLKQRSGRDFIPLVTALLLMSAAIFAGFTWLVIDGSFGNVFAKLYLLPWIAMTAAAVVAPCAYVFYRGQFSLFHPLVFAAWSYFFPAFVVGGLIMASGIVTPYFLHFIQEPEFNLPLTFVYISVGFAALSLGFLIPYGRMTGAYIERRLPEWNWQPDSLFAPAIILLLLGVADTIFGYVIGILGYQQSARFESYEGALSILTLFLIQASFLLWLIIFKKKQLDFRHYLVIALLAATSFAKAAFAGNRSSLVHVLILIVAAFVFSGKRVRGFHVALISVLLVVMLLVGMIYGTTFRTVKDDESRVAIGQYVEYIGTTFDRLSNQDTGVILGQGFQALAERLENVSSLAVVVSNYEQLAPYEEGYGLDNNILKDTFTFFVPRLLWADKPLASDPRKYADLYFDYPDNSFTITPMGDLLRNFGPWGVPLGMFLLGLLLRIIYAALIENQTVSIWRSGLYFMLLTSISYETFYGYLIPYLVKVLVVSILGFLIIRLLAPRPKMELSIV